MPRKYDRMFNGSSARSRAFLKKSGKDHELGDYLSKKAWMTCSLSFRWLYQFNAPFAKRHRKMLLLIRNYCAYGTASTIPTMGNVEIVFHSSKTTFKLQPYDAGRILALRVRHKSFQVERVIDLSEEESCADIY